MFKKLIIASAVFAASCSVSFAGPCNFKCETPCAMPCAPCAPCANPCSPCPCPCFAAGPYIGGSLGMRDNIGSRDSGAYRGIEGTLSAGYGTMLSPCWYLAGEFFGGDSINLQDHHAGVQGVRTSWSYGLDVIPGFMLTDYVLAYARGGVVRTRFSDRGVNATGGRAGLGLQTSLCQCWDLRGEYVYTYYGSVSTLGKPQSDQVNVGLVYKFL